jgi:hypothetical protein
MIEKLKDSTKIQRRWEIDGSLKMGDGSFTKMQKFNAII